MSHPASHVARGTPALAFTQVLFVHANSSGVHTVDELHVALAENCPAGHSVQPSRSSKNLPIGHSGHCDFFVNPQAALLPDPMASSMTLGQQWNAL